MNPLEKSELAVLAERINHLHDLAEEHKTSAVVYAARCGEQLLMAKAGVQHGEWLPWLEGNCRVVHRQAQKYMKLAKDMPELLDTKTNPSSYLIGINHAIALLSADDDVQAEVQTRLEAGETVTVKDIEALKRQAREAERWKTCAQTVQAQAEDWKQKARQAEQALANRTPQYIEKILQVTPPDYDDAKRRAERAAHLQSELDTARAQLAEFQAEIARKTDEAIRRGFQHRQAELDTLEERKESLERMVAARLDRFSRFNATLDANQDIADECAKLAVAFGGFTASVSAHEIPGLEPRTRAQAERVRYLIDGAARALDLLLSLPDLPQEYVVGETA